MRGVAVQLNWRDIEPLEGKPDWSRLDALFAAAESSNRWLRLSIFPGFFSPEWALEGANTDVFEISAVASVAAAVDAEVAAAK
jgi:hypothetical protein